jgi:lipoprotein-anchoring transpeptidase ErfK/SrfK
VTPTVTRVLSEPVSAPTPIVTPAPSSTLHVVQEAETLSGIARRYGVSVGELVRVNELANPDLLYVGQELALPRGASDPATRESDPTTVPIEPTREPSPLSPDRTVEDRWIDVDISEQRLTAYEADTPVRTTLVSTGLPNTPTPLGEFRIWIKFRFDDMAGSDYYIEDVPYVMYFHEGYGLHGVTWHGNFGHPMSHGCVNLPTEQAEWLFGWAEVGTLVVINE